MKPLRFVWRILRRLVWETTTDNTTGLSAQLAYLLLVAMAPGLLFLWHLLGLFGTDPSKLHKIFLILKGLHAAGSQSAGHSRYRCRQCGRHWSQRNAGECRHYSRHLFRDGVHCNDFAGFKPHPRRGRIAIGGPETIVSFFLLFWFGITILLCFNVVVFGETLAGLAEVNFQLTIPLQEWVRALNLPFTALALVILALALYLLTPENYLTIPQALPGAIVFSVGWITVTKLFQFYVARYDRYNPTYLALASIIVLLTWMYLVCLLLLLGGKLNAILRRDRDRRSTSPSSTPVKQAA
jgi:membrane protein